MYATLKCSPGYAFQRNYQIFNLTCDKGEWTAPPGPSNGSATSDTLQDSVPSCLPVCEPECLNGGKCIMPNVCECPGGFKGFTCRNRIEMLCKQSPKANEHSTIKYK